MGGPVFVPCGTYKEWNAGWIITQCMKMNAYSRKSGWHPSSEAAQPGRTGRLWGEHGYSLSHLAPGLEVPIDRIGLSVMPRRSRPGWLIDTSVGFFLRPIERPQSSTGVGTTRWSFRRDRFHRGSVRWPDQFVVGDSHRSECSSPWRKSVQAPTRSP